MMEIIENEICRICGKTRLAEKMEWGAPICPEHIGCSIWISVKDRLPEPNNDKEYLTTCEFGGVFVEGYYEHDGKVGWISDFAGTENPVTHWMPLPEPPEPTDA